MTRGRARSPRQPVAAKRVGARRRRTRRASARLRMAGSLRRWRSNRFSAASVILVTVLSLAGLKLVYLQAFQAEALSEQSQRQRATLMDIPAHRGDIVDRNGEDLAFSVETRSLQVSLKHMRKAWEKVVKQNPESPRTFQTRIAEIASYIAKTVPDKVTRDEVLEKLSQPADFTYLVHGVEPSVADDITKAFPEIAQERRAHREYPAGTHASNVVGFANWRMNSPDQSKHNVHGLIGLESGRDNDLAGTPGSRLVDTGEGDNVVIPGTERDIRPAVDGSDLELTLDADVQYDLQRRLADYVEKTNADGGSAVIMDARTGEVYALANDKSFDPQNLRSASEDELRNRAVTTPYEPGSVAKVITAAAAIEHGVTTPPSRMMVPGRIQVADRTISDAWEHGTVRFTTTGIFAKSSNVGSLMLAQKVGADRWLETARLLGLGERTGIGLPGESAGVVPPRDQWSGSTFGNLPIGQGLSMTVVQMAGMYQTIANDGVRVQPRIVRATVQPDGTRIPEPEPQRVRAVSEQTADTVLQMLRATVQDGPGQNDGTAPRAAVEGYQISGKTGTAQQINPVTGSYSRSKYNITFAGILPADDPRFVVGLMLDAPDTTLPLGHSAGPLFRDIAAFLAQRFEIPLSSKKAPVVKLVD